MTELLAVFGVNWKLLVIQAINFGLVLVVLWRFLYQPVLRIIDKRRQAIVEGVQKAEAADRRLSEADVEGKDIVARAAKDAEHFVASARSRADKEAVEIAERARERADIALTEATAKAEEERRQAIHASEKEIARAAMLAAEKILREKTA